ncbi:hypothetical protein BU16DRAFT_234999 [Lophium mytilinum]|uniref:Glycosyltransferase 2-like domain-containing protein n=1 Tax=Lophium mytilinum TaxID=390894 RepID=A0A6A6R5H0_9PEZI|nr:hypothetical protein BU16DRAFT_234999 [Lophium mytilinum]
MGTIFYNSKGHWENSFLTVGELSRITQDFGRFRLPFKLHARPTLGWVHGSFILVKGEIEHAVGWDTDCLAEDFWFGLRAANKGYKFGWLEAIAREQPPRSIRDVCAQRRRWCAGIWSTGEPLARLSYAACFVYFAGIGHVLWVVFLKETPIAIPRWLFVWGILHCAESLWSAITSTVAQDYDAGNIPLSTMVWHVILTFFLSPIFGLMECAVIIHAIFHPPKRFHVVKKV